MINVMSAHNHRHINKKNTTSSKSISYWLGQNTILSYLTMLRQNDKLQGQPKLLLFDGGGKKKQGKKKGKEKGIITPLIKKFWFQRYSLFSKYGKGIKIDEDGWYSVTPEEITIKHNEKCDGGGLVIDFFFGVSGNAIQFARLCSFVIAIYVDPQKVELAINNARVYGVEDYIDFIVGDFLQLVPSLKTVNIN
ncbi:S-adenosyl-L-methionine-dependent methyltransferases superfamily protein, putative isoform 2 [Theobroma cacao]|uniref:Trimethylguanosine synthase n=1 Tax=Theobroma cacao TaxID=3641 RepID=A0A061GGM2_THECC|nr:S-adenosyl-L-methionine-dependent methyltransferases superfamily protein, putative isoform 2 [Theobroma cacao]